MKRREHMIMTSERTGSRMARAAEWCGLALLLPAVGAHASVIFATDCLPPSHKYIERGPINYPPVPITLTSILHYGFTGPCQSPPQAGDPPLVETFGSTVSGIVNNTLPFTAPA